MNFRDLRTLPALLILLAGPMLAPEQDANGATRSQDLLAYDASRPLDVEVISSETRDGVTVEDIAFEGTAYRDRQQAFLIRPSKGTTAGSYAGVLFVHWFAHPDPSSNRTQFLDEAKALARRGTVSLLVSAYWEDAARHRGRRWQDDFRNTIDQAKELRRALDVLMAQPDVDARRVGYVGHDYGAMFGAAISAADERPKAYVLIAGASRFPDWYLYGSASGVPAGADLHHFREQFNALDPVGVVSGSRAAFLFQYGEDDRHTPRENFIELYLAAPTPKRLLTYSSGHAMAASEIRRDRIEWIATRLRLPD